MSRVKGLIYVVRVVSGLCP